jgi:hypothetical protein
MYLWVHYLIIRHPHYTQVEFFVHVDPAADSPTRIGTINMFYTFDVEQSTTLTFVELSILPILEKHTNTNLYIVPKICRSEARLDGFSRVPSGETSIIFIDSIVKKIKLVPHWTDEDRMCAIRMWDAR